MATLAKRLAPAARRCAVQIPLWPRAPLAAPRRRALSSTSRRGAHLSERETRVSSKHFRATLTPTERAVYDSLSPAERDEYQMEWEAVAEQFNSPDIQARLNAKISTAANEVEMEMPDEEKDNERVVPGFMNMGEEDEEGTGNDDEFKQDDISSSAHAELEQHREIREYARIAAWEMPLLSRLAKPFVPPDKHTPLRFRYTTYMGEQHPAERKVVVEFCTQDMPNLTDSQREKLIKLVGVRYNPETDIVKMSCEMFETQAQNKRYLGDLVDTLLKEARDSTDTFADIPLDFRHHKFKVKLEFPIAWRMTPERREYLEESRRQRQLLDKTREETGKLIDGTEEIVKAHAAVLAASPRVALPVPERPGITRRIGRPRPLRGMSSRV